MTERNSNEVKAHFDGLEHFPVIVNAKIGDIGWKKTPGVSK